MPCEFSNLYLDQMDPEINNNNISNVPEFLKDRSGMN
jgi:hypothetical protein